MKIYCQSIWSNSIDYIFAYNGEGLKAKIFDVLTNENARRSSDHSPIMDVIEFS